MKYCILVLFVVQFFIPCFSMKRDAPISDNKRQVKRSCIQWQHSFKDGCSQKHLQYPSFLLRAGVPYPCTAHARVGEVNQGVKEPFTNNDWSSFSHVYRHVCSKYSISYTSGIADHKSLLLVLAAARGHETLVKYMLEANPLITSYKSAYTTLLLAAARGGHKHIIEYLIKQGADVHEAWKSALADQDVDAALNLVQGQELDGNTLIGTNAMFLINALEAGSKAFIEKIIAAGAGVNACSAEGMTPLMRAAQLGDKELVKLLLENKADVNKVDSAQCSALIYAIQAGYDDIAKLFISYGAPIEDDLLWTVINNEESLVSKLLTLKSALVNVQDKQSGNSALMCAIKKRNESIATELIQRGASVNTANKKGQTALMFAALEGLEKIVTLLLERAANSGAQDNSGLTALMFAIYRGHAGVVRILLNHTADVRVRTKEGWDALMIAADKGNKEVVEMLLAKGADSNAQNPTNDNALTRALLRKHTEVVDTLIGKGANVHKSLLLAASNGYLEVVTRLVELGANTSIRIPHRNYTPLVLAREGRHEEVSNFLELCTQPGILLYRQDPNAYVDSHIQQCFVHKKYPRTCLVHFNECYFEQKAPDHSICYHQTVLMWACIFGHAHIVEKILLSGVPSWYISAQDKFGCTALHYAIIYGHTPCINTMLRWHTADKERIKELYEDNPEALKKARALSGINLCNAKGSSALMHAIKKGNLGLISRLIEAGAWPSSKAIKLAVTLGHKEIAIKLLFLLSPDGKQYPHIF